MNSSSYWLHEWLLCLFSRKGPITIFPECVSISKGACVHGVVDKEKVDFGGKKEEEEKKEK
jgi:hypothetical protein